MRVLCWHVHGAWMTAFVNGPHTFLVPVTADRGRYGAGRALTYPWPASAVEVAPGDPAAADVDVVVLQRPEEYDLVSRWFGRRPGVDVPACYVEHNTPKGDVPDTRHPMADRPELLLVHVTHFNALMWDAGTTPTAVVEHGIPDPQARYSGEQVRLAAVINEPVRRWRVTGTDLLPRFAAVAPVDVFGMKCDPLPARLGTADVHAMGDLRQTAMHAAMARRRLYLHPHRWTSLGLSLIEAMMIGMPVVALASTEAVRAVPVGAGVLSTDVDELVDAARWLLGDPAAARAMGARAREAALARYRLDRFLADWDTVLTRVAEGAELARATR